MNTAVETKRALLSPKADVAIVLAVCALAGAAVALIQHVHFLLAPLALALLAGAIVALAVFGFSGLLALIPLMLAFSLLQRFDETFAIPLEHHVALKPTFYLTFLCVALLGARVLLNPTSGALGKPELQRFLRRFFWTLAGFIVAGLITIGINCFFDDYLIDRDLTAELLALTVVVLPVFFVLLLPRCGLSRARTLWAIRFMIGLGGLAGFILAAFGILPGRVLDLIGWTQAIGGTLDLVRGRLPLGHPNSVAAVILLLMPPAVVFGLGCDKGVWRLFHLACAALMFLGVLFALSRSAMLCLVLILAPTMLYLIWRARGWRRVVLSGLSFVFCAALVAIALYLFSQYDFSRFWSRGYHEDASVARRTDSLYTALAVWRDYPLFGISPDAFYMRFDIRKDWDMPGRDEISGLLFYKDRISAETPHNVFLMALSEFGLPGGSLFLLLLFYPLQMLWRARKQPLISDYDRLALSGLVFGFCGFLLMQFFGAELLAALRASIVFWVAAAFAANYAGLVENDAKRFAENTMISHANPSGQCNATEPMGTP